MPIRVHVEKQTPWIRAIRKTREDPVGPRQDPIRPRGNFSVAAIVSQDQDFLEVAKELRTVVKEQKR